MLFSVGVVTFAAPSVGHHMLHDSYVASVQDVLVIMGLLRQHLQGSTMLLSFLLLEHPLQSML